MNCHKMMCATLCGFLFGLSGFAEKDVPLSANALLPEGFDTSAAKSSNAVSSMMAHRKILSSEGLALKDNIKVEYGEGHGETIDEALKEAMKDVLQKVVGVYVDSDFRMNNDEIIKDEIITHSNGFIDHYKKIEEADDANGRGKTVTIKAWVKMRDFVNRIKKIAPSQTVEMDGKMIDIDLSNTVSAETLLKKELENLNPAMDMLEVKLVEGIRPVVMKTDDESVTLRYVFQASYSKTKYNNIITRLGRVLDQIAESTPQNKIISCKEYEAKLFPVIYDSTANQDGGAVLKVWNKCPVMGHCLMPVNFERKPPDCVRVVISSNKSGAVNVREWQLTENLFSVYTGYFKKCSDRCRHVTFRLSLLDGNGEALALSTCELALHWYYISVNCYERGKRIDFLPYIGTWSWVDTAKLKDGESWLRCDGWEGWYDRYLGCIDISIDRKNVAKIKTAKVSLETNK